MAQPDRFAFGDFVLERTEQRVLRSDGTQMPLTPRLFGALLVFVERSGELLDKGWIMAAVWPDLVVEENNLNQVVWGLRRALGDDAHGSRFIETVPRRGFRFVAPVTVLSRDANRPAPAQAVAPEEAASGAASVRRVGRRWPRWQWGAVVSTCAAGIGVLLTLALYSRSAPPSIDAELADRRSIAVMSFTDLGNPKAPEIAHAFDHDLTVNLGRLPHIRVVSSESSAALGSADVVDPRRVGRELDVRHVVAGSVRRDGGNLVVTVRLTRTDTGALLWSDRFDYPLAESAGAQHDILARVSNLLDAKVQQSMLERAVLSPPGNTAVDHWMRGTYGMTALATREQLALARAHFEAALTAQPDSVPALAGLAHTHLSEVHARWSQDRKQSVAIAKALAKRAVVLDPDDQESLLMLSCALNFAGELDDAITTTRRLLQLNPNDIAANRELAISLYFLGRWEDTLRQVDVAERLNPLDSDNMSALHDTAATALVALHRYDDAIDRARRGAATNPSNLVPLLVIASAEAHRNNLAAAREQVAEILKRQPGYWVGRDRASRGSTAPAYVAARDHFAAGLKLAGLPGSPPLPATPGNR